MPQLSLHSPVGALTLCEEDGSIVALDWGWASQQDPTPLLRRVSGLIDDYFDGAALPADLPLSPSGGTAYQNRVWAVLRGIPPGEVRTYGDVARLAGGSPRSVGGANGANPIPILIPCHRVVAANGIGGYSGGEGVPTKQFLLRLERGRAAMSEGGAWQAGLNEQPRVNENHAKTERVERR